MQQTESIENLQCHQLRSIEGPMEIRRKYRRIFGKDLADIPHTFTEKLYHKMLTIDRESSTIYTRFTDKFAVRDYVRERCGDQYLVNLIWSGTDPDGIPFDDLPQRSVLKPNHASGMIMLLQEPIDRGAAVHSARKWMSENFYWRQREYQYYDIVPCLMIEHFIDDGAANWPRPYCLWCFHGSPELIQISYETFFDVHWNKMPVHIPSRCLPPVDLERPENLGEMLRVASALSRDFDFVRIDLYSVKSRIYFSEMTFTPDAGMMTLEPVDWDLRLGEKWVFY